MSEFEIGDRVQVRGSSTSATVLRLDVQKDDAGGTYVMAILQGARGRIFREETTRLLKVGKPEGASSE